MIFVILGGSLGPLLTQDCHMKWMEEVNKEEGLTLIEVAEGVDIPDILNSTGCEFKVNF